MSLDAKLPSLKDKLADKDKLVKEVKTEKKVELKVKKK